MRQLLIVLATVVALLGGGLAAPAEAGHARLGKLWAGNKVLEPGCHNYRYQYHVRARAVEWSLETYLRDRTGQTVASNAKDSEINRKRGQGRFRLCRYSTKPGRFKIIGKLTRYNGYEQRTGWVKPGYFRMRLR
jgi:hypothetical protein